MESINRFHAAIRAFALAVLLSTGSLSYATDVPICWTDEGATHNWTDENNWNPNDTGRNAIETTTLTSEKPVTAPGDCRWPERNAN